MPVDMTSLRPTNSRITRHGTRLWWACVVALVTTTSAAAQYNPGDLIVAPGFYSGGPSGRFHLLGVTPSQKVYTIQAPSIDTVYGMMPSPDNQSIWIAGKGPSIVPGVYNLAPNGAFTTIARYVHLRLLGADGMGGALALQWTVGLVRISGAGTIATLFPSLNFFHAGAGIDLQSGDVILDQQISTERITLGSSPALTTIAVKPATVPRLYGLLAYDPVSDLLLGGADGGPLPPSLCAMQCRGSVSVARVAKFPRSQGGALESIDLDPASRLALLALRSPVAPSYSRVLLFDLAKWVAVGPVITGSSSLMLTASFAVRARSRHLNGISKAVRGTSFSALVSVPGQPGMPYVVGFSLGTRPGIRTADGRTIALRLDPLFSLSLSVNSLFSGCIGVLDSNGEATAKLHIPREQSLSGLRVFAAAVTFAGGQIRTISAPIGVTIQ